MKHPKHPKVRKDSVVICTHDGELHRSRELISEIAEQIENAPGGFLYAYSLDYGSNTWYLFTTQPSDNNKLTDYIENVYAEAKVEESLGNCRVVVTFPHTDNDSSKEFDDLELESLDDITEAVKIHIRESILGI